MLGRETLFWKNHKKKKRASKHILKRYEQVHAWKCHKESHFFMENKKLKRGMDMVIHVLIPEPRR